MLQIQDFKGIQDKEVFFVTKHQYLKAVFVQIPVKMIFNGDGQYLMSKGKQLAKRHSDQFLAKIHIEATFLHGLV
jgi:hypothetical protein